MQLGGFLTLLSRGTYVREPDPPMPKIEFLQDLLEVIFEVILEVILSSSSHLQGEEIAVLYVREIA